MSATLKDKFRGALVGAAVGDALGAFFEGPFTILPNEIEAAAEQAELMRYTDDTHMTIGMAQSLIEQGGFDGKHMATRFAKNLAAEPWRGYAAGPPQVLYQFAQGVPWDEAGKTLFNGAGSYGNGGAMRVSPAALAGFPDFDRVVSLARQTALITHAHELGIEGAVLQACAIALALGHDSSEQIDANLFINALRERVATPIFHEKLDKVTDLLAQVDVAPIIVATELGRGIEAHESVPTAIYSFLRHQSVAGGFKDTVIYAISLGGDTDTIASMAGAISGAHLGVNAIPSAWRSKTEGMIYLMELADGLYDLANS